MKKRTKLRNQKLSRIVLIWALTTGITLAAITCIAVGVPYFQNAYIRISNTAHGFAETTADCIDASRIPGYVQTLEKDDYYQDIQYLINVLTEEQTSIDYIFVVVPQEDGWFYVWTSEGADKNLKLGEILPYSDDSEQVLQWVSDKDHDPKMFRGQFGRLTAFYPICDSDGKPVALVGVNLARTGECLYSTSS